MIGRISTLQFNKSGVSTILGGAELKLARLQEQIGTGQAASMTPADDPSAAVQACKVKIRVSSQKLASEQKNIAAVTSALSFEEVSVR